MEPVAALVLALPPGFNCTVVDIHMPRGFPQILLADPVGWHLLSVKPNQLKVRFSTTVLSTIYSTQLGKALILVFLSAVLLTDRTTRSKFFKMLRTSFLSVLNPSYNRNRLESNLPPTSVLWQNPWYNNPSMKQGIHPNWHHDCVVTCSCGNKFTIGSVSQTLQVDICSKCHPFFTGEMKFVDRQGRVDRFRKKLETAQAKQNAGQKRAPAKAGQKTDPRSYQDILRDQKAALRKSATSQTENKDATATQQ
jgi:large subunit ribosomal protein L31